MSEARLAAIETKLLDLEDLKAQLRELQDVKARLRELEDVREITDCFRKFHWACCGGFNGLQAGRMEALDQLADDATIEVKGLHEPGKGPTGRKQYTAYWEYYYGDAGPLPRVFQTTVSEWVEVEGDTATGYSVMLAFLEFRGGGAPWMTLAMRINNYVRTDKGWKIKSTTINGGFESDINELKGGHNGLLNELPPQEERQEWKWPGV
jgi:hypothetical protein